MTGPISRTNATLYVEEGGAKDKRVAEIVLCIATILATIAASTFRLKARLDGSGSHKKWKHLSGDQDDYRLIG